MGLVTRIKWNNPVGKKLGLVRFQRPQTRGWLVHGNCFLGVLHKYLIYTYVQFLLTKHACDKRLCNIVPYIGENWWHRDTVSIQYHWVTFVIYSLTMIKVHQYNHKQINNCADTVFTQYLLAEDQRVWYGFLTIYTILEFTYNMAT